MSTVLRINVHKPLPVTAATAHELFELRGGELFWRVNRKSVKAGDLAGRITSNGYCKVKVDGRSLQRSRLVWLMVYGEDPYPMLLDHINRIRNDDRVENLRKVTHGENQRNRSWGTSSERYVYNDEGAWRVRVPTPLGRVSVGTYRTEDEAIAALRGWETRQCQPS